MAAPALRVILDGDNEKVYRKEDKVTGRVILVVEEQQEIESLKIAFLGSCVTRTTRPFVGGSNNNVLLRKEYEEKIRLFNRETELLTGSSLTPHKYSWTFEFAFPESTEQQYKRLVHGASYLREPHALPPTFQLKTNVPGGAAQISYFVQAKVVLAGSRETRRYKQVLRYHPRSQVDVPREARVIPAVLYGQTWKPSREKEDPQTAVNKMFSRRSTARGPRIVPCVSHPEKIAPGQHIPLSISLLNTRDTLNKAQGECTLESVSVTISTFSTSMCGHAVTQPEDVVSQHVTCMARTSINKPLPFGETKTLTSNFRLIDDVECVPTFKTYTISRRYALNVTVGIKYHEQHFTIRHNTPLEILPRIPRDMVPPPPDERDDIDTLPLYKPREPSKEFAPDYESIYALSSTNSNSNSNSLAR